MYYYSIYRNNILLFYSFDCLNNNFEYTSFLHYTCTFLLTKCPCSYVISSFYYSIDSNYIILSFYSSGSPLHYTSVYQIDILLLYSSDLVLECQQWRKKLRIDEKSAMAIGGVGKHGMTPPPPCKILNTSLDLSVLVVWLIVIKY